CFRSESQMDKYSSADLNILFFFKIIFRCCDLQYDFEKVIFEKILSYFRDSNMTEFKIKTGCIPCSFVCDCCQITCYRCSSSKDMFYKGDENKPTVILCGECIKF